MKTYIDRLKEDVMKEISHQEPLGSLYLPQGGQAASRCGFKEFAVDATMLHLVAGRLEDVRVAE